MAQVNSNDEGYLQLMESQNIINDQYSNIDRIDPNGGDGCFSLVFTAYDHSTKEEVILKFFHPKHLSNKDRLDRFYREGKILEILRGEPNILESIDTVCDLEIELTSSSTPLPIRQYYQFIPLKKAKGNVERFIYSSLSTPEKCLIYFREMCKAVNRIHGKLICHRDLKPSNFLIFTGDDIRLGDFGTSKHLDGSMEDIRKIYIDRIGDRTYTAPEALFFETGISDQHVYSADIFSLGAILFEMFSQTELYSYLYDPNNNRDYYAYLTILGRTLSSLPKKEKTEYYLKHMDYLASTVNFPDIYLFNDFVPNSIKYFLNSLYKDLTQINLFKRYHLFESVYRRINICLLILRNEEAYGRMLAKRRILRKRKN